MISAFKSKIPFFSVIITTFNRKHLIQRALDSLLKQTEQDWEAIIVDDGSNDDTFSVCSDYCQKHDNIKYIYHSNRGSGLSKNAGILASSGLFVTFLDSDDEYMPEHLESRKRLIIENQEVGFIHGGCNIIGSEYVPDKYNPGQLIHLDKCAIGGTFFIRRDIAIGLGGFPPICFGDDTELFAMAVSSGIAIGETDEKTYIYHRESGDSICSSVEKITPAP